VEGFWREIRVALRSLLRTPGYTTSVICILAIGIGVTTVRRRIPSDLLRFQAGPAAEGAMKSRWHWRLLPAPAEPVPEAHSLPSQ